MYSHGTYEQNCQVLQRNRLTFDLYIILPKPKSPTYTQSRIIPHQFMHWQSKICRGTCCSLVSPFWFTPKDSKEITKHLVLTSILTNYSDRKQPKPHKAPTQGIYSNNIKIVKKVCTQVIETSKEYGIYECIHTMASKTNLVQLNHAELNAINSDW